MEGDEYLEPYLAGETPYQLWQKQQGIPINRGSYVSDLYNLEVAPWPMTGQKGAFLSLGGQEQDDGYVLEIAPAGQTEPLHHLFEATIVVLEGRGATSFWQDGKGPKQAVEWQRGSVFAPPLNCFYQHFNLDGQRSARLLAVTFAPTAINFFADPDFVFNCPYAFTKRYGAEEDYFTRPAYRIQGGERLERRPWKTNFVPDVRSYELEGREQNAVPGQRTASWVLANNRMTVGCIEFPVGVYRKAHWHGPSAHVLILSGQGYSLLWFEGEERRKVDWKDGTVISPEEGEYHQHFNTGPIPVRYMPIRRGVLMREGTNFLNSSRPNPNSRYRSGPTGGIPYDEQDLAIHELYVQECANHGVEVAMPPRSRREPG